MSNPQDDLSGFCPMPYHYGSMRIDPVASVQHLNDPIAEAEAQNLHTQRYLVYLYHEHGLPFPDIPWFTYIVTPIGAGLRPPEPENAITPEMCIPIYPNEEHPTGRAPLRTIPAFPFSNCYHWIQLGLNVRVRAKPENEVFDATHAVHLPVPQRLDMLDCWEADHDRADATLRRRRKKALALSGGSGVSVPPTSGAPDSDASSCISTSSEESDDHESEYSSSGSMGGIDVFGILDRDVGKLDYPLVDFSYDLRATLSVDDIPNPMDLLAEHNVLLGIIKRAHERSDRKLRYGESIFDADDYNGGADIHARQQPDVQMGGRKPGCCSVRGLRRWQRSTAIWARRIRHTIRLPYLVIWP